jgi:hypothetical protein
MPLTDIQYEEVTDTASLPDKVVPNQHENNRRSSQAIQLGAPTPYL